jgi:hypothetical protein
MLIEVNLFIEEGYFIIQRGAVLFEELFAVVDVLVGSEVHVVDVVVDVRVVVEA